jgi:hypothetical protein
MATKDDSDNKFNSAVSYNIIDVFGDRASLCHGQQLTSGRELEAAILATRLAKKTLFS